MKTETFQVLALTILYRLIFEAKEQKGILIATPAISKQYNLLLKGEDGHQRVLKLYNFTGDTADELELAWYGEGSFIYNLPNLPVTHHPLKPLELTLTFTGQHIQPFHQEVASYDQYGKNQHHPTGGVSVREELFRSTGRGYDKPVLWIVWGDSNLI